MYLKRLELQGFKTFASRTVFEFAPGMTAVVGPNGSGKSNLADALRWVLGEQSLRTLRCKKTEDVVFAGGAGKPPAGMAEVSITFDNTAGWLDTPFQEVVVTRRAYRSGENEYLINRDRVRLRDVADLLLKANISPNGYTIIGQGMVDLALSLKAEERRELFEDAAGIRHHYVKLNEARGRLATTEVNLSRVRDVIAEIEPRLKSLERRARQLRERDAVRAELRAHLAAWYGHRWLQGRAEVEAAEQAEREAAAALAEARAAADATAEEASTLARRQNELRGRLAEIERARVDLLGQGERLERELALRHERANAARARIVELRAEVDELAARAAADEAALRTTRSQLERLEADVARLSAEVAAAEGANDERRQRADRLRAQLQEAQALQLRLNQEEAALRAELEKVAPRRAELQAEISRQTEAAAQDEERALAVRAEIDRHEAAMAEAEAAAKQAEAEAERLRVELASCRLHQETIALRVAELARERAAVQGRLDVLTDAREGYAGYYAGVRAVLAAARDVGARGREAARTAASPARRIQTSEGRLEGIVGLVASLVRVPPHLETAIEVALGSHLQDLVVERWEHAEAAVAFLKKTNAGRATFLPLDTVRGGASPPPVGAGAGPGVLGVASALAQFDEPYRAVMEHLLGRTLVVQDLPTARQALRSIGGGWQIVTLGGEVVRSSGAITGGAGQGADRTLLARERERRELPERLAAAVASGKSAESELAALRAHQVELEAALRRVGEARVAAERRAAAARVERGAAAARAERLAREVEWSRGMTERARAELAALDEVERATRERLAALPEHGGEHAQLVATLRARLAELDSAMREQDEQLSRVRSSVAVIEGERRAHTRLLESHAERRERIAAEIEARRRRIDELTGSAAALDGEAEEIEAARGALEDQRAALAAEAEPIQRELAELAEQARLIAAGEPAGRAQLNELADKVRAVALAAQSARDHLDGLVREGLAELAELEPDASPLSAGEGGRGPGEGPLRGDVSADPTVLLEADPQPGPLPPREEALEPPAAFVAAPLANADAAFRRIEQLRARLRAIGAVDATAGQEYDETLARHAFLEGQAADLVDAAKLLREAIAELETTMQTKFESTFEAVAAAFKRHFTALFGGGTARLVLSEAEASAVPGVEIIAQPPGKRAQSLSLLSGGERALTAVAILFAILEVNPTPFCMLDEVDAALDDANIVRFGQVLRRLAERTQFVVITHNRGTMEAADALYGVSMVDRSTSRTVSLRLADLPATA